MSFLLLSSLALVAWSEPVPLFRRATIGANFNFVTVESGQLGSLAVRLATTRAPALAPVLRSNESALPTAWFFDATLGAMDVYNESYRRWWRAHANATAFREQRVLVRNATAVLAAALAVETRVCLLECVTRLRAEFGVDAAVELTDLAELTVLLQRGFAWPTAPDAIALRNVRAITHLVNDAFVYSLNSAPAGLVMPGFHAKIAALLRAQTSSLSVLLNTNDACAVDDVDCVWAQTLAWSLVFGADQRAWPADHKQLPPSLAIAAANATSPMLHFGVARANMTHANATLYLRDFDVGHVVVYPCDGGDGEMPVMLDNAAWRNDVPLSVVRARDWHLGTWRTSALQRAVFPMAVAPCEAMLLLRDGASIDTGDAPPAPVVLPPAPTAAGEFAVDRVTLFALVGAVLVLSCCLCACRLYRVRAGSWREPWRIVSLLLVGGWLVGQAALIGVTYKNYLARDETALLGLGIPVARSMAAVLRVNCALVTLPVSRLLLTHLSLPAAAMSMHKMIGIAIAVQAAIHTVGHAFNFHAMSQMPSAMFAAHFPTLVFEEGKTPTVVQLSLLQLRGATGVAMVILFAVGMLAALPVVRSVAYERFELFHLATLPALVLLCVHGIGGVLESPSAWMYMVGPLAVLVVERLWRLWRAAHSECDVVDLWVPTNNVVEVTLSCGRPEFARLLRHGDYAYVAMPGDREWHPFCVVSTALEAPRVRLLIDRSGEWTRSLQLSLLNGLERLRLTGPYHSEGVAMTNFHTLVLCAGGTGVTPFCSLIGALVDNKDEVLGSVRRVVLLWSCRSDQHFLMLSPLLRRIADAAEPRVIVRLFATQQTLAGSKVERYEEDESLIDRHNRVSGLDVVTLGHSVELRRPDWSKELSGAVSNDNDTGDVGVFACGPRALTKDVRRICRQLSSSVLLTPSICGNATAARNFVFHKLHAGD